MTGTPTRTLKSSTGHQTSTVPRNGESRTGLWVYRPFTRVVRGYKAYTIVKDYIQLNEQEARGVIRYQSKRLRGLSMADWELLWS